MSYIQENINKARLKIEKANKILTSLDTLPANSIKIYIDDLISAMNLISEVIFEIENETESDNSGITFEHLDKAILEKMKIEDKLHNLYFYMRNLTNRNIEKTEEGIRVSNWKTSRTFSKSELKSFLMAVDELFNLVNARAAC